MPRYLVLFLALSVVSTALSACEDLPEAVVKRNSALQGNMGWSGGFAPLPPLSEPAPPAQPVQANTDTGFTDLPALPFPPLNPLPEPSPAQAEEPSSATPSTPTSPAPASSPAAGDAPVVTPSQRP